MVTAEASYELIEEKELETRSTLMSSKINTIVQTSFTPTLYSTISLIIFKFKLKYYLKLNKSVMVKKKIHNIVNIIK